MCGIVGATLPTNKKVSREDINLMYLMAEERGGHACGYTDRKKIYKEPLKSPEFLPKITIDDTNEFIGHTRYKTFGENNRDNAHPFNFENVLGVHNGSIYNWQDLRTKYAQNHDVDSQLTYWMINELGLKETLPQLRGWMAFAFWDKKNNNVLNLYRLGKPLWIGKKDDGYYFGSLEDYVKAIGCTETQEIEEHVIYKFKDGNLIETQKLSEEFRPVFQDKAYVPPTYNKPTNANLSKKTEDKAEPKIGKFMNNIPWHAKSGIQEDTGKLIFWWAGSKEGVYNVMEENKYTISRYDIAGGRRDDISLSSDYPEIYDELLDDYLKVLTTKERVQRILDGDTK
jgi:asparagine synthetase B (glutamine-hydrolysing)